MYDPKFEKAVQQKMEELEFRPAESVWVNIEKAVVADRRRRGAGFFWWFLVPGLFLAGAAGAYFYQGTARSSVKIAKTAEATPAGSGQTAATRQTTAVRETATIRQGTAVRGTVTIRQGTAIRGTVTIRQGTAIRGTGTAGQATGAREKDEMSQDGRVQQMRTRGGSASKREGLDVTEVANGMETTQATKAANKTESAAAKSADRFNWFYLPGLVDQRLSPQVHGMALKTQKSSISLTELSQKKHRWEAGFTGGGGWSRLNRLNASQAQAAVNPMAQSFYNINGSSSSKHYISETRPGASFYGGIYLQRALSSRWTVNTGMNLHYYSNNISIGQELPTYVNASASYFYPTTAAVSQTTTMYTTGNQQSYTNRYYFLELPVGVQWELSQNHILPVFLEGGVSLSRLMGADALFYNAKTGLYSKDGNVANKTQFNISSAVLFGLPFHGVRIQLGPQVQYGLTPLVNSSGLGDQHFFYAGLRFVIIPGRK